jgi:hypothetical protein
MGDLSTLAEHLDAVTGEALLVLPYRGREYQVLPAETSRGLRCAAFHAASTLEDATERDAQRKQILQAQVAWERRRAERLPEAERADRLAVLDALAGNALQILALGVEVADQLDVDGVPEPDAEVLAYTALVAHVQGPAAARGYARRLAARRTGQDADSGEASPRPRPSRSGRGTGSASRTRKGSSRATTSPKS